MLALTRIDSGVDRGSPAPFDLTNLVQEVANDGDFEARARNRSVMIKQADACTINGFEELLRSAVENVVRNAIRHTAEGTAVEISLQFSNARALLRVRDHGPGVPDSMLSEIFLPFRRVANGNSTAPAWASRSRSARSIFIKGRSEREMPTTEAWWWRSIYRWGSGAGTRACRVATRGDACGRFQLKASVETSLDTAGTSARATS